MINLRDARITDSLPPVIASQPWAQALAAAIHVQVQKILQYADSSRTYSAIDRLPHRILDILAFDLRVPNYSESYSISVKRRLIKNALVYYSQAGTLFAVRQLCEDVFGTAKVTEWFDYGGEPGYFRIYTENPGINDLTVSQLTKMLVAVKRLSAWLESITIDITVGTLVAYYGLGLYCEQQVTFVTNKPKITPRGCTAYIGGAIHTGTTITLPILAI